MPKNDKIRMPTGMAGITRYDEDPKESIKIKPHHIIGFIAALIVVELILKFFV